MAEELKVWAVEATRTEFATVHIVAATADEARDLFIAEEATIDCGWHSGETIVDGVKEVPAIPANQLAVYGDSDVTQEQYLTIKEGACPTSTPSK